MLQRLAIIVPCYNEEKRLPQEKFIEFAQQNSHIDFWFINDGSRDNTLAVLEKMQRRLPEKVFIHSMKTNSGKAEAVRQGMQLVSIGEDYPHIGFLDADLSAPLTEVNTLYEAFKDNPKLLLAAGCRVKMVGSTIERSTVRHYISRLFVTYYANVLKIPNYDTQCGIKLFERKLALQLFARPFVSKWLFDIEIFIRTMEQTGMVDYTQNVKEGPLHEWREVAGSKLKLTDFIKAPIEIFRIYKAYFKKKIAD
jgi:glycosyltransferase involved in cell wall biosynthesis